MLIHRHCQMTPPAVSHTDGDGRIFACLIKVTLFPLKDSLPRAPSTPFAPSSIPLLLCIYYCLYLILQVPCRLLIITLPQPMTCGALSLLHRRLTAGQVIVASGAFPGSFRKAVYTKTGVGANKRFLQTYITALGRF